jgi:UPF0755 protein
LTFDRNAFRLVAIVVILAVAAVGMALSWIFYAPNEFADQSEKSIYISRGQSFAALVDSLETHGIIRSRPLFVFVAKILGGEKRIRVGKYVFESGISNISLFRALRDGSDIAYIPVTIREGIRSRIQGQIFAHAIGIDSGRYVELVHDESFVRSLGIDAASLEGYLLPETYKLQWQLDEKDVIRRQVDQFKRAYNDSLQTRAKELGWTTNQVLTLASIIEGEAVLPSERPIIACVYHNRLRKGMRLEADPTLQYMFEDGPRRVRYSDLKMDNPYNTYLHSGLPPGPINSPGKASILAALYPARYDYLYFVANGKGGHWFSSTYAEHSRYVRMYRRQRAQALVNSITRDGPRKRATSDLRR